MKRIILSVALLLGACSSTQDAAQDVTPGTQVEAVAQTSTTLATEEPATEEPATDKASVCGAWVANVGEDYDLEIVDTDLGPVCIENGNMLHYSGDCTAFGSYDNSTDAFVDLIGVPPTGGFVGYGYVCTDK